LNRKNDNEMVDLESFERELEGLRPAKPPEEFLARLAKALPDGPPAQRRAPELKHHWIPWRFLLRWLAPAAAVVAIIALLSWRDELRSPHPVARGPNLTTPKLLKADNVEIDQRLVAAFDAVARLPDGEPVRFRCREWTDQVVLRDSARGITIERRTPRLEVIPVSLETY
jgi:hypothetical protein